MPAPARVGESAAAVNGVNLSLSFPAGSAAGHLAVITRIHNNTGSVTATLPTGWTLLAQTTYGSTVATVIGKILTSGDISTGSVVLACSGSNRHSATCHTVSNGDLATVSATINGQTAVTVATWTAPTGTAPTTKTLVIEVFGERGSAASTSVTIAGATQRASAFNTGAAACSIVGSDDGLANSGTTVGGDTATWNTAQSAHTGVLIMVPQIPDVPPPPPVTNWTELVAGVEHPITAEGVWNGATIDPFGSVEIST